MDVWGGQVCDVTAVNLGRLFSCLVDTGALFSEITGLFMPEGEGTRVGLLYRDFDSATPVGRHGFEGMGGQSSIRGGAHGNGRR
jgi:CO dehydrogenase/acetyl-CoA synthase beta subunit